MSLPVPDRMFAAAFNIELTCVYLPLLTEEKNEWKNEAEIQIAGGKERLLFRIEKGSVTRNAPSDV